MKDKRSRNTSTLLPEKLPKKCCNLDFFVLQVCESLSRLSNSQREQSERSPGQPKRSPNPEAAEVEVVKVVEAWAPLPEQVQGYVQDWDR